MIIVYTPQGGEPEQYDARTLRVSEASIVSRTVGKTWGEIKQGLGVEDLDAMRGVVWVIKKRTQPGLRFNDVDPGVEEMVTRLDREEVGNWIAGLLAARAQDPEVTDADYDAAVASMLAAAADREHAEQLLKELTEEQEQGKAEANPTPADVPSSPTPTSTGPAASTSVSSLTSAISPQPVSTS
jgi:hypothetical protein